jgi:hypothetical protein
MSEESAAINPTAYEQEPAESRERIVEIRCGFAEMAQREAAAAAERVSDARRLCEEHAAALARAQSQVDPGLTHTAKEKAHSSFRAAVAAARSRGQVETAAVVWLAEINRINAENRFALAVIEHGHATADALQAQLTNLSDTAEASAAAAVAAMEACRAARAALASALPAYGAWTPEVAALAAKAAARAAAAGTPAAAHGPAAAAPAMPTGGEASESSDGLAIDLGAAHPQLIIRLVRRDGRAMNALVEHLAGNDPSARSVWQLHLSILVDSIVASAIDDACFEFIPGNPFWDQFQAAESREVARGLAALGFRYDGFGGFVDGRVPSQRDLALALGQVGLLPVKVRHWPSPDETAQLFLGVRVSADKFLAARAPALTLGEMVRLLGRRAQLLADLWNEWPRCRPMLFSTGL